VRVHCCGGNPLLQGLTKAVELGHPHLAEAALRALAELSSVGNEMSPLRLAHPARSALMALVGALGLKDEEMQLLATAAISDVAPYAWDRSTDASTAACSHLLSIIQSAEGEAVRDQAAWAVWGLASNLDLTASLSQGIGTVVGLLRAESDRAREAGGWLTWCVASKAENVAAVVREGGVYALLCVLARGSLEAQEAAAWGIWAIADADRSAAKEFVDGGAVEALKELAATGSPSGQVKNGMLLSTTHNDPCETKMHTRDWLV
jgi:hypothetical protein